MGNHFSQGSPATGKVILVDGSIQEFNKPLTVAELMLEYPQQVVVELQPVTGTLTHQKRPTPLPADKKLEFDKFYLMVPLRRGKPAHLSAQEAHHILLRANTMIRSKTLVSVSKFLPLFTKICPVNSTEDGHCKLVVPKKRLILEEKEKEKEEYDDGVEDFEVLIERPDYLSRQVSGKGWKPSLDTIEEMIKKDEIRKMSNLVVLGCKVGKRIESKGLVWG